MDRESSSRLDAMFAAYSANLAAHESAQEGRFRCPICMRYFSRSRGVPLRQIVAEEHIVPRALGGGPVTLDCRKCNNGPGSRLDKHLIQRVLVEHRKRPIKARVQIGNSEHGAELHIPIDVTGGEPIQLIGVKNWSDPRQVEKAKEAMMAGARTIKLKATLEYVEQHSQVALIRAAYLMMFRTFGYSYVLDPSAAVVRAQLDTPGVRTPITGGIMWNVPDPPVTETSVAIMSQPESCRAFCVLLRLHRTPCHVAAVALPAPGCDGSTLYKMLRSEEASGEKTVHVLPRIRMFLPLREVWDYVLHKHTSARV